MHPWKFSKKICVTPGSNPGTPTIKLQTKTGHRIVVVFTAGGRAVAVRFRLARQDSPRSLMDRTRASEARDPGSIPGGGTKKIKNTKIKIKN